MDSSNQIYPLGQLCNTGSSQVVCSSPFFTVPSLTRQSEQTPPANTGFGYKHTEIHPRNSAAFQGQSPWQGQEISAANVRQSCGCRSAVPSAAPHPPNPLSAAAELEEPGLFVISTVTHALPDLFNSFSALCSWSSDKTTQVQGARSERWGEAGSRGELPAAQTGLSPGKVDRGAGGELCHMLPAHSEILLTWDQPGCCSQGPLKPAADTGLWVATQTRPCCQARAPVPYHSWRREKNTSTAGLSTLLTISGISKAFCSAQISSLASLSPQAGTGSPRLYF